MIKTQELCAVLGLSRPAVLAKARRHGWRAQKNGREFLWDEASLPADVRLALSKAAARPARKADEALLEAGGAQQQTAAQRASLLYEYERSGLKPAEFCHAYNECGAYPLLYEALGKVSQTTLYRWLKAYRELGAGGLVPQYGTSRGGAGESLRQEEKDLLKKFWLRGSQPTMMHAYRLMRECIPYSTATYQTAVRYLHSLPKPVAGLFRLGESRFENLFLPHMEQHLDEYRSLDVVVSDHHCIDCVVRYRGKLVRPWVTTFQDLRSGKVLGWCPSVKPGSMSITAAYYLCCLRYGVPRGLLFDNGKDYRGRFLNGYSDTVKVLKPDGITEEEEVQFKGVFALVGSEVHFTRAYNGKSKGRQERYFRLIGEYLAKDIGTYVGSDSRSRPEDAALLFRAINGKAQREDIPEWTDFVNALGAVIEYINDTFKSNGRGMEGRTRSEVFLAHLPPQDEIRHVSKEVLQKALSRGSVRSCGRNGVRVGKVNYWHPALFEYQGRQVLVYENLLTAEEVTVCRPDGAYLCTALANYFGETGNLEADIARLTQARRSLKALAEAGTGEVTAAAEVETMIAVAQRQYAGAERIRIESDVDRFLGVTDEAGEQRQKKQAAGLEQAAGKTTLKHPFYTD